MCFSCICLFVLHMLVFVPFLFLLVSGMVAVCDSGAPWAFMLSFCILSHEFHLDKISDIQQNFI